MAISGDAFLEMFMPEAFKNSGILNRAIHRRTGGG